MLERGPILEPPALAARRFKGPYIRSISVLASGSAAGQLAVVAATPIVTRIYSPATFGSFSLFFTYVTFTAAIATLTYHAAIVSAQNLEDAAALLWSSLLICIPGSVLGGLGMLGLIHFHLLGFGTFSAWVALLGAASIGLTASYTSFRSWCVREGHFGAVSRASVGQSLGRVLGQVLGGLLQASFVSLVISDALGRILGIRGLRRLAIPDARAALPTKSKTRLLETLSRYRDFPLLYLPSTFLNNLVVWLPLPLIIAHYGISAGGYYAITTQVLSLPVMLAGTSVADVFHSSATAMVHRGQRPLGLMWKTVAGLFVIGGGPALLIAFFGPQIFEMALGGRWAMAGSIAALMAPWLLAELCVSSVSRIVLVCNGQRVKLLYDITLVILTSGSFAVAFHYDLKLLELIKLLSVVNIFGYLVYLALLVRLARKGPATCAE